MNHKVLSLLIIFVTFCSPSGYAGPEQAPMVVWVNEAVVATYSYSYKNYLQEQKQIAKYFTADAWINYTKALNDSKLPESIQKNLYFVSAVPTQPPVITRIDANNWKATMNLLVVYQNPQYQQHQDLKIIMSFATAPADQGVRGYSITSLKSIASKPPCQCVPQEDSPPPINVKGAK